MSDTNMIQNKTEEYDYIREIEEFKHKKNNLKQSQKGKPPSPCWLCGDLQFDRNCPFRHHICNICGKKVIRKLSAKAKPKAPSKNKVAAKKARPAKSVSGVSSTYETDGINRRQHVILTTNGRKVRMQLVTASNIALISRKTWEKLGSPTVRPSNHVARNAPGDVLKLKGELECQVCLGDGQIHTKCFLTEHYLLTYFTYFTYLTLYLPI